MHVYNLSTSNHEGLNLNLTCEFFIVGHNHIVSRLMNEIPLNRSSCPLTRSCANHNSNNRNLKYDLKRYFFYILLKLGHSQDSCEELNKKKRCSGSVWLTETERRGGNGWSWSTLLYFRRQSDKDSDTKCHVWNSLMYIYCCLVPYFFS